MFTVRSPRHLFAILIITIGCDSDITVTETARCDGRLQSQEGDIVDSPFDQDGDGYFDGDNLDCREAYTVESLDCDDDDPEVHPGSSEIGCNGIDDDCDETTLDEGDGDGDGISVCEDCNDDDPEVYPGADEIVCNQIDDDCDEATVDAEDEDEDGWDECDDCDDWNPDVHPEADEIPCNEIDDDCDEDTVDAWDVDGDGIDECEDCNDEDPNVSPDAEEVCEDDIDNDCDDLVDEDCEVDFGGSWIMDSSANYSCAWGLVSISVGQLEITDAWPLISVDTPGSQPGTLTGTFTTDRIFEADNILSGGCTETYEIIGEFVTDTVLNATLSARFTGGAGCLDCTNQSWTFTAYR